MKVLVTGATGFLGRSLLPQLLEKGQEVRVLVRSSSDTSWLTNYDGVEIVTGDITEPKSLEGIEKGIARVFHLAVLGHLSGATDGASYLCVNRTGTTNLLARFVASGVERIVFTTTTAALGPIGDRIVTERDWAPPVTEYGRSKLAAERVANELAIAHGLPLVMVRLSHVYGPGEVRDLYRIIRLIRRGILPQVGIAPNLYPAVFLDDAVHGLMLAMDHGRAGETYLITDRKSHDLRDIRRIVMNELGLRCLVVPFLPKVPALAAAGLLDRIGELTGLRFPVSRKNLEFITTGRRFSIEKARRELGYEPEVTLEEGLRRTIAWYRQEGLL